MESSTERPTESPTESPADITNGQIMDKTTMTCRRWRKKKKKKTEGMSNDEITLYTRLKEWSKVNPYGKVVKVEMNKCKWPQYLIQHGTSSKGSHIHTQTSKWKYFKINLGTATSIG